MQRREKRARDLIKRKKLTEYYQSSDRANNISIQEFRSAMQNFENLNSDDIKGYTEAFKNRDEFLHLNKACLAACISYVKMITKTWKEIEMSDFSDRKMSIDILRNTGLGAGTDQTVDQELCSTMYRYAVWIKDNV